jgi:cell division septum initiation protein DivIVA
VSQDAPYLSDIADAEQWLAGWQQRLAEKQTQARELAARITSLRGEAESPDGTVRIVVDSTGVPVDLTLGRDAAGRDPARLAAEILATMRRAQARLTRAATEAANQTIGAETETARALLQPFYSRFPEERQDEEGNR